MRADLRRLHSPDIDDLSAYQPEKADDFGFLLQVFIGPENGVGEESFDVTVCTPKWLERKHEQTDVVLGCHHLIMFEYSYDRLWQEIQRFSKSVQGESWQEIAPQLLKLGKWEFEGYVE